MTTIEAILSSALFSTLAPVAGVNVQADTSETFTALIDDFDVMPEPGQEIAQAKDPVYKRIKGPALCVAAPRSVGLFTETESLKTYRVIKFDESRDPLYWSWICEAQLL